MLFRPSYCANCGEKIERSEWHLWTSRRFCELCETEFKGVELIPKVVVALGLVGIVLGISGYIGGGSRVQQPMVARQVAGSATPVGQRVNSAAVPQVGNSEPVRPANATSAPISALATNQAPRPAPVEKAAAEGPIYFCGAQTKKGTPCSRKVKGNVRCFQHTGMPAMLPSEKLRAG